MKSKEEQFKDRVRLWRKDPNHWVADTFGGNIKLSNQQSDAFTQLGKLIQTKIKLSKDEKLSEEELFYADKIGVDISSGMGTGKDFFASLAILYFLHVFPEEQGQSPHVLATANTSKQLSNVLWRQLASIPSLSVKINPDDPMSSTILDELFVFQSEKVYLRPYGGKRHFAEAVTVSPHASSDEQSRALTGRHAPYMLMVLDEAAGLPEAVFTNLEGTLSGRVNLLLMIYNPIKSKGYAIDARDTGRWVSINWNAEDTDFGNPSLDIPIKARNKDLLERYGRDSNAYRIRVLGRPPIADQDVFIPWDWVQDAVNREIEPNDEDLVIMGVDPAAGGDNSVITVRHGGKIIHLSRFNLSDTMEFTKRVMDAYYRYDPVIVNIDPIGIGKGVYDRLLQLKCRVAAIDVRRKARNKDRFDRIRDELWWTLREQFEHGIISIPNDQELIDQLANIRVKDYSLKGQMRIPTKPEMRRKDSVGGSTDEGDAICLTYAIPEITLRRTRKVDEDEARERRARRRNRKRNAVTGY
jgi:hypothetical protein